MQALPSSSSGSALAAARAALAEGGVRALYRGLAPPLAGSAVFRATQFAVYGAVYGGLRGGFAAEPVPWLAGLQPRVLAAGVAAATARTLLEVPLQVIKVRRQLGVPVLPPAARAAGLAAVARELSAGWALSWLRMCVALGGFFVAVDHVDRHHAAAFDHPTLGAFAKGALCATAPWALAWPLEVAATQAQSSLHGAGGGVRARLAAIVRDRGAAGLFRGAGPGLLRSVVGNGAALAAFELCRARLAPQA
jgi:solute carrier family 25 carnitine/acylcarnitine transporter 20/29